MARKNTLKRFAGLSCLIMACAMGSHHRHAKATTDVAPQKIVMQIKVDDAIGPATAEYILTGIELAKKKALMALLLN